MILNSSSVGTLRHFVRSNPPPPVNAPASQDPASAREPASKRLKLGKSGQTADFICQTALIVPVEPLPSQKAAITTILHRLPRPGRFPTLPNENGTSSYICFQSCFAAPHDRCVTKKCVHQQARPPTSRLHIDISVDFWKNKPETYWKKLVEWLQLPGVTPHFSPSAAFKALTPTAAWP
jgi:hypothetical protein